MNILHARNANKYTGKGHIIDEYSNLLKKLKILLIEYNFQIFLYLDVKRYILYYIISTNYSALCPIETQ